MALTAVARLTYANGMRQPLTWLVLGLGVALLVMSYLFGMFSFVDENRMRLLLSAGVAVILLMGFFLGVVSAAGAVHDELASRTALTLFAKPMSRSSFLFGKVLGVWAMVLTVGVALALIHLLLVRLAIVSGFDWDLAQQHHSPTDVGFVPWARTMAAHGLTVIANGTMVCVAAVLALRLPLAANILVCFAIFVLANLLGALGFTSVFVLPSLHLFHVDDSLHFVDMPLSVGYFTLCLAHAGLYGLGSLLIGLAAFSRQDIP